MKRLFRGEAYRPYRLRYNIFRFLIFRLNIVAADVSDKKAGVVISYCQRFFFVA
ncbi:MAG: hypothetical protein LBJ00_04880 [Planctomycetaceae bacterium]|nr:hypothetical protein [Planctomycetaceae bacterium]